MDESREVRGAICLCVRVWVGGVDWRVDGKGDVWVLVVEPKPYLRDVVS